MSDAVARDRAQPEAVAFVDLRRREDRFRRRCDAAHHEDIDEVSRERELQRQVGRTAAEVGDGDDLVDRALAHHSVAADGDRVWRDAAAPRALELRIAQDVKRPIPSTLVARAQRGRCAALRPVSDGTLV